MYTKNGHREQVEREEKWISSEGRSVTHTTGAKVIPIDGAVDTGWAKVEDDDPCDPKAEKGHAAQKAR